MDINWLGLMKSAAISVVCLGGAILLLRDARRRALRNQNRTTLVSPNAQYVRCAYGGGHVVKKALAAIDGETYDGEQIFICHQHRFLRKRQLREDGVA